MDNTQTTKARLSSFTTVAAIALAYWPVLLWYFSRTLDRSDEPWGLLALATAVVLLVFDARKPGVHHTEFSSSGQVVWSSSLSQCTMIVALSAYILTFRIAPNLVQSGLLVIAIWLVLVTRLTMPSKAGILGLLLLALPVVPSLNFYAGYPIRYIVAMGSSFMLNCLGIPAMQEGTILSINHQLVAIDAPCSGINMLWAEAYTAMLVATIFNLNARMTALLGGFVLFLIPIGNVLRATTLVLFDRVKSSHLLANAAPAEPTMHVIVGLVTFSLVTGVTLFLAHRLSLKSQNSGHSQSLPTPTEPVWSRATSLAQSCIMILCLIAAVVPFVARPTISATTPEAAPVWPATVNGFKLVPVESLAEERAFAADFPGQMKRFTDGTNAYFIRYVHKETRQLHPSSDCFKGLGYSVEPRPIVVASDGTRWSSFEAAKSNARYVIMERLYDAEGHSWTDVSEWYWSACLGKSKGPWFDVTIAKPYN